MTDYTDLIAKLRMVERKDISSHLYPFAPGVVAMAEECIAALEQLVAERDAAVADLHKALRSEVGSPCDLCLYDAEAPDGMGLLQHWRVAE